MVGCLTPDADDTVLVKWRYSVFHCFPLEQTLKESGHNQLVIARVYAHIGCIATIAGTLMHDVKPLVVTDALANSSHGKHLISLKYVIGRSGWVVMIGELLSTPIPVNKTTLRKVILPLLDELNGSFDDDNPIDYSLNSAHMATLAAHWRRVHSDTDFATLAENPVIDAWWKLLFYEVR